MTGKLDMLAESRASFDRMNVMKTLGASLDQVEKGAVTILLPMSLHILQQHGFVHAGVIATIADTACGYAAFTLMPPGSAVLTSEFKINLLSPAKGDSFEAVAKVIRAGKRVHVAMAEVFALTGESRKLIAVMLATLMVVDGDTGLVG